MEEEKEEEGKGDCSIVFDVREGLVGDEGLDGVDVHEDLVGVVGGCEG